MPSKKAIRMREILELSISHLDDRLLSEVPTFCPLMRNSHAELPAGTRIQWDGKILKSKIPLWDEPQYDPAHAPDCWTELNYRHGIRLIPAKISVTDAFAKNEQGLWKDIVYISTVDANCYTPEECPQNWKQVPSDSP